MFGRELTLPIDMALGRPVREERLSATDHAYQLEQMLLEIQFARKHLTLARDSMKRRYNIKANYVQYKVGEPVWYFKPKRKVGFNSKLQRQWKGPFVVGCLNDGLYKVQTGP